MDLKSERIWFSLLALSSRLNAARACLTCTECMTLNCTGDNDSLLVVSTVDLVLFPYTDSLHATMSDDDKGKKTRPLFIFRAGKPFSLPATTHHVTSLLKILNLITRETNLTSAWNTLTSLHVGCHGLSFSWQ